MVLLKAIVQAEYRRTIKCLVKSEVEYVPICLPGDIRSRYKWERVPGNRQKLTVACKVVWAPALSEWHASCPSSR